MCFQLKTVEIKHEISKEEFQESFVRKSTPVILKNYSAHWNARNKWTFKFFKEKYGHIDVPVMSEAFATSGDSYVGGNKTMKFSAYLDLIEREPTKLRIFLFNLFKAAPELREDFDFPPLINSYVTSHPFVFFGGATSFVDAHMDLDMSHVFMTQFAGSKKVVLFDPKYSTQLYRHPLTVSTNVDVGHPDYVKYPLLKNLPGYECTLNHGDTLFMPSGMWHYVYYNEGGFALSLRSMPEKLSQKLYGAYRIAMLLGADRAMTKAMGASKWYQVKEAWAHRRAAQLS